MEVYIYPGMNDINREVSSQEGMTSRRDIFPGRNDIKKDYSPPPSPEGTI